MLTIFNESCPHCYTKPLVLEQVSYLRHQNKTLCRADCCSKVLERAGEMQDERYVLPAWLHDPEEAYCPCCHATPYRYRVLRQFPQDNLEFAEAECCRRTVVNALVNTVLVASRPAGEKLVSEYLYRVEVDISPVPGVVELDNARPQSRWTEVCCEGFLYYVQLKPKFTDNSALGIPNGLSMHGQFSTPYAAHQNADAIDSYFDGLAKVLAGS